MFSTITLLIAVMISFLESEQWCGIKNDVMVAVVGVAILPTRLLMGVYDAGDYAGLMSVHLSQPALYCRSCNRLFIIIIIIINKKLS